MIIIYRCKMEELLKVELGDDEGYYMINFKELKSSQLINWFIFDLILYFYR